VSGSGCASSTTSPALPVAELYRDLSERLEQIVRFDVRAPESVVEEACQFAWGRLMDHRHRVRRESALSWLARTAVREALKLHARTGRYVSLESTLDGERAAALPTLAGPDELFERRERLQSIRRLPERQQQVLWLHALGLSYAEIAQHTGWSTRTVERQLLRARRAVREAAA
jgi:RNA polymerase sigma factor (sigma-70 family)